MAQQVRNVQSAIVVNQEKHPDKEQGKAGEKRAVTWPRVSHKELKPLTLVRERVLWPGRCGAWGCGRSRARDVPVGGCQRARQTNHPKYYQDHGKCVAKREESAAHLIEKKQNAERDKN